MFMARKRILDEDVIRLLRQIEVETASGASVAEACRTAGVSDAHLLWLAEEVWRHGAF